MEAFLSYLVNIRHVAAQTQASGLRLMECVRSRVQDIDFDYHCIRVWNGKGGKHRVMNLANKLTASLHVQITKVKHYLSLDQQDQ